MTREEATALAKELQPDRTVCAGCSKPLAKQAGGIAIELAPMVEVKVCYHGVSLSYGARAACALKVRQRAGLCPGCGYSHVTFGTICKHCVESIDYAHRARSGEQAKVRYVFKDPFNALEQSHDVQRTMTHALCEALDPVNGTSWGHDGKPLRKSDGEGGYSGSGAIVEITEPQAVNLRTFFDLLQAAITARIAMGEERGRSMLMDLAAGRLSIEKFNEQQTSLARNRRGQVDE